MYVDDFQILREEVYADMRRRERKILDAWCKEAKLESPIGYHNELDKLTIYTDRPGCLIGKGGKLVDKYRQIFREEFHNPDASIAFVEIRTGFANC